MASTTLSRRSGVRAPSGAVRPKKINPNALPRPKQPTSFDVDIDAEGTDTPPLSTAESYPDEDVDETSSPVDGLQLLNERNEPYDEGTPYKSGEEDGQDNSQRRHAQWFEAEDQNLSDGNQSLGHLQEHSSDDSRRSSVPSSPLIFPAPPIISHRAPARITDTIPAPAPASTSESDNAEQVPESTEAVKHYTHEIETQETLRRERTRILQRTVVSSYRQIDYKDITGVEPLKKGGFGEIHRAEWSRLQVVLKRALVEHNEGVEQFDQELEILKRVHDYDFIVPFYGVTTDPRTGVRCMVMKYCSNGNLCSFLENNHSNLPWEERYRLSIEITKGLEFLHKSGFYHRDLHSGNILLDDKMTAMICDFGLSRSSSKEKTNDLSAAVGVASFLAPERFPTQRPMYSAACDVYSLGVIFWHISSGRIPFVARLRDPRLLRELMDGRREEIIPGTPREYRDLLVKCWDAIPTRRLKIDVVIDILQMLIEKLSEPVYPVQVGFMVPSSTTSAALPVPPQLEPKMASLERASNMLNKMVFDIKDPIMRETVDYIDRTRARFRDQRTLPTPYSSTNPPQTPVYFCPLVGDIAALNYYLAYHRPYNPINESSMQTGDTALHLACLFLESPLDTIKVLVELGADINLENLQGYTPVMMLVSSNTQYCYEALRYFIMRGAKIPEYIRKPIAPMDNAQIYALNLINESRQMHLNGSRPINYIRPPRNRCIGQPNEQNEEQSQNQDQNQKRSHTMQGRPLFHVVAAMQEDYRILDCLREAGLKPAIAHGSDTALIAAAAHLQIKNIEWLLNNDLDSSIESNVTRAIAVVKMIYGSSPASSEERHAPTSNANSNENNNVSGINRYNGRLLRRMEPGDIRELGKYSWAGVAYRNTNQFSKDMVGPVLQLLEQWTGHRRIIARRDVAAKLRLMGGMGFHPLIPAANAHIANGFGHSVVSSMAY
ncbi:hypothetical protein BGZ54_006466 [Gamsiella multidivaricata]|nr:hypothetical protein BGZ54_006466 [Gamsiella multidivaricata]